MLLQPILDKCHVLRMPHMGKAIREQMDNPAMVSLDKLEWLGLLIDAEVHGREQSKQNRLLRHANLKMNVCMEDIDYSVQRGLDRPTMAHLATLQFVRAGLNVLITGPSGIGKTHISCALGNAAIRQGLSVYSIRLARLLETLEIKRGDGTLMAYRRKLAKYDMLIIDDWMMIPIGERVRHDFLELIDERLGHGSLVMTSQYPVEQWHDYFGDPTVADAILDRIVHRSHRIEMKGPSMRKLQEIQLVNQKEDVTA